MVLLAARTNSICARCTNFAGNQSDISFLSYSNTTRYDTHSAHKTKVQTEQTRGATHNTQSSKLYDFSSSLKRPNAKLLLG
eukprot:1189633-Amphidinium_carterae.1